MILSDRRRASIDNSIAYPSLATCSVESVDHLPRSVLRCSPIVRRGGTADRSPLASGSLLLRHEDPQIKLYSVSPAPSVQLASRFRREIVGWVLERARGRGKSMSCGLSPMLDQHTRGQPRHTGCRTTTRWHAVIVLLVVVPLFALPAEGFGASAAFGTCARVGLKWGLSTVRGGIISHECSISRHGLRERRVKGLQMAIIRRVTSEEEVSDAQKSVV